MTPAIERNAMKTPVKLKTLTPYVPDTNVYAVRLDANESFIEPPGWLAEKIGKALASVRLNRYPDPIASEVCAAAAQLYGVPPGCCVAGNGSDELISVIISSLLPRGGKVVIAEPDFSMYRFYSELCEVSCLSEDRESGYPSLSRLLEASANADMLIFSNPCNPTGQGIGYKEMIRLLDGAPCLTVIDEAYMDFWDQSVVREIATRENLIVLRTCSKAFGLAGIRLGFAFACESIATMLRTVKSPYNVSSLAQAAGLAVLKEAGYIRDCTERIKESKASLFEGLKKLLAGREGCSVIETVTNFALISLPDAASVHKALQKAGVSVRLIGGMLRVTAGSPEENGEFLKALEKAHPLDAT